MDNELLLSVADLISEKEMPAGFGYICSTIGMKPACLLLIHFSGIALDIPKSGLTLLHKLFIQENFDGENLLSIAVKLGIDAAEVRSLAKTLEAEHISANPEMPNEHTRLIEEKCGRDVAIALITNFPGKRIYIPQRGIYILKKKFIENKFTGNNSLELAMRLEVSQCFVRKIVADMYSEKVQQTTLFETV